MAISTEPTAKPYRKKAIPAAVRREVARRYGAEFGEIGDHPKARLSRRTGGLQRES